MKYSWSKFSTLLFYIVIITVFLLFNSCSQYDYYSPQPGILEIRLKAKSTNITFDSLSSYALRVSKVEALRDDGARAEVFNDVTAIKRTVTTYNILEYRFTDPAFNIVIGASYLPPGNYLGVNFLATPDSVLYLDKDTPIDVRVPIGSTGTTGSTLRFLKPFEIKEALTTEIIVTIDLDSTIEKGANWYYYRSKSSSYTVTSITVH